MLDVPRGDDILTAVAGWLRETALPQLPAHLTFQARVAANAIDLVAREMREGPSAQQRAQARLAALLEHDGDEPALRAELAVRIRDGSLSLDAPGLIDHLLACAIDKVAIDQPSYASLRAELDRQPDPVQPGGRPTRAAAAPDQ